MPEYSDYIEGLTNADTLDGTEIVGLSQGGNARKATVSAVRSSSLSAIVQWDFAAQGGLHPVDLTKVYISTDDSVYPENTWFASDGVGGWYTK